MSTFFRAGLISDGRRGAAARSRAWRLEVETLEPRVVLSTNPLSTAPLGTVPAVAGEIAVVGNVAFFVGSDSDYGPELWRTDGTPGGTRLVKDINPGTTFDWETEAEVPAGSSISDMTPFQGKLFFSASVDDGVNVLWMSDGTAEGTIEVSPQVIAPRGLVPVGGELLFLGAASEDSGDKLWKYTADGGVEEVSSIAGIEAAGTFAVVGDRLFVTGLQGGETPALFEVGESIEVVRSFPFDADNASGYEVAIIGQVGDVIYLSAYDDVHGMELWKSDGTPEGTVLVKDINPGVTRYENDWFLDDEDQIVTLPNDSFPGYLTPIGGGVALFSAFTQKNGHELWKTDGTEAGTVLVKDLVPGSTRYRDSFTGKSETYPNGSFPRGFTAFAGATYFSTFDGGLWRTDGTTKGTVIVKKVGAKESSIDSSSLVEPQPVVFNGRLLYQAYSTKAGSWELWTSDGTAKGTLPLKDLPPAVISVAIPDSGTYAAGAALSFTVTFDGPVNVRGKPTLSLDVGGKARKATYAAGSGTADLVFTYTVAAGDADANGIVVANKIAGTVTSVASPKVKALPAVPAVTTSGILIDAVPPVVLSVVAPEAKTYGAGDTMVILVTFSEAVRVNGPAVPQIAVNFGSTVRQASYVSVIDTNTLRFELVVAPGDSAPKGVRIATTITLSSGSSISDSYGNIARKLVFKRLATAGVKVGSS